MPRLVYNIGASIANIGLLVARTYYGLTCFIFDWYLRIWVKSILQFRLPWSRDVPKTELVERLLKKDPPYGRHRTIHIEEREYHYVEAGNPRGDLILFLHGFPHCWYLWRYQLEHFGKSNQYHLIALDMKGFGGSFKPTKPSEYEPHRLASDIRQFIHQIGYENATLVGHDWGGIIAWYCAMFEPRIVKNLVIMNAPHIPTMMNNLFLRNKNVERMEVLKQLLATFYIAIITLPWPFYNIWLTWRNYEVIRTIVSDGGRRSREDVDMYVAAFSLPNVVHTTRCYYKYAMHAKMDAKRDITAPTLVLWGNYDWALREKVCLTGLEECVYDLDICILERESHMIPESRPRDVNDALEEFLQKHDTTTERRE